METVSFSGNNSFQWKPFLLVEAVHFNGNHCPQWKTFLLVEAISLEETIGLQWKQFLLVETAPFDRWHFLYWKLFLLLEAIHFSANYSLQFFPQSLCFWWKSLRTVETNLFRRSLFFLVKTWWKLLLLIKTFPFRGSHSFQCFNIFTSRSYQKLPEYLNINDSVRSLKMANLSCIHIPGEVFQSSERYLEPSRTSGVTADGFFLQKSSIADVRLGSKYASGIVLLYSICVLEFQHDH